MTTTPDRLSSALSDRYRIDRELGQGGMATVYLAEDLKHGRKVAIKVLHPELSAVIGGDRFLAEIKVTANLQHPHILGLIDSGEADGLLYYVMPYVAGESLRGRLIRDKQLPVEDALRLTKEVASALDYAHRQGVVHRDIKPENILLQDGAALVADFGIALAVQQAGGSRMTQTGMSLGTPAYMSPEQAMGEREIGARSDVYALGAMAYEMLAGEPPFTGPNSQAIVAKVLTEQPLPLRTKRPLVSPAAEGAILTALQKLPADRFGSAKEFAEALTDGGTAGRRGGEYAATVPMPSARAVAPSRRRAVVGAIALTAIAAAAAVAGWSARGTPRVPTSRLAILAPGLGGTGGSSSLRHLAFEPDGQTLVYSLVSPEGGIYLVRQALWDEDPTPIPGAIQVNSPLVSPDGRFVLGTRIQDNTVYRVPMAGGSPQQVRTAGGRTNDAAWAPDGTLWFSWNESDAYRLYQLAGDSLVVRLRGSSGQFFLQQILPDGKTALVVQSRIGVGGGPVVLLDLETGKETPLPVTQVVEARVTQGYLVYTTTTATLQAISFDLGNRRVTGSPVTLANNVSITGTGLAQMAVAQNGNIAYVPEEPFSLVFVERNGSSRIATPERRNFHHPTFSPDGRRLSTDFSTAEGRNVWVFDLAERTLSRATFDRDGHDATWAPDGRFLSYIAPVPQRGGELALLRKPPGTAEPAETLYSSPRLAYTGIWLRDGSGLITTGIGLRRDTLRPDSLQPDTRTDIGIIRNGGRGPLEPLVASPFGEAYAGISPDGRWLAFVSDQSGRDEVYLRELKGSGDQVLVSSGGGTEPVWSPDGRELYYRETEAGAHLVAAAIVTSPAPRVLTRTRLFPIGDIVATNPHANYDISPDGRTFVMVRRSPAARIVVIQNLPGLVQKLQGTAASP